MGSSLSNSGQKALSRKVLGLLRRASSIITEPHENVQGTRRRQQARLLSILLLMAIVVFVYEFTSAQNPFYGTVYLSASFLALICYFGSRTRFFEYTLKFSLAAITTGPPIIMLYGVQVDSVILENMSIWFFAAMLIGTLLTNPRTVLFQGIIVFCIILVYVIAANGFPFQEFGEGFGTATIIILLMLVCSYMLEDYINKEMERTAEVRRQRWELEVYTQLLRHDLRNDLQAVLSSIELADLTSSINTEIAHNHMDTALEIGNSMVRLLSTFSMPMEIPNTDIVSLIEELARRAERNHPGLNVNVNAAEETRDLAFTASRLMPMVWNNIFRNAAQYAGEEPVVTVDIVLDNDDFILSVEDDGPGIHEAEIEWLFKRGKGVDSKERGLGLYLAKVILESHNGSIELVDNSKKNGTKFIIRLPVEAIY